MPDSGFLLIDCLDLFLLDRRAQNLADKSIDIYRRRLRGFVLWCTENDLHHIDALKVKLIRSYQVHLGQRKKKSTPTNQVSRDE